MPTSGRPSRWWYFKRRLQMKPRMRVWRHAYAILTTDRSALLYAEVGYVPRVVVLSDGTQVPLSSGGPRLRLTLGWFVWPSITHVAHILLITAGPLWLEIER